MPPFRQYLSPWRKKRQTSPLRPPKSTDPGTLRAFSLQTGRFRGTAGRAMIAIVDPRPSRRRGGWAKAMPPLWQYFSPLLKATRAHLRTQ